MARGTPPTLEEETRLFEQGYAIVAGVDEVGRGALAGPVAAAAVVLQPGASFAWLAGVRDSKMLTAKQREELAPQIRRDAAGVAVAMVEVADIDERGILKATWLAMKRALDELPVKAQFVLVDGSRISRFPLPQKAIVRGDKLCLSIACASIVAKVARDRLMVDLDREYPGYGLAKHKGYGCAEHFESLSRLGSSPIHRRSFAPVSRVLMGLE